MKLGIIIASTRPERKGSILGQWFYEQARQHSGVEASLIELAEVNLPLLDESAHPRLQQYAHAHTKAWSEQVAALDAFVFVTPEYNFGTPPALNNALNYLYKEWNYKPAGFVSYGGISGGTRSVEMTKQILGALKVVPLVEAVTIPLFAKHLTEAQTFDANDIQIQAAANLVKELQRWHGALKTLRA